MQVSRQNADVQDDVASLSAFGCYIKAFKNYVCFSGRASRKEYWYFGLFQFLISACIGILCGMIASKTLSWIYNVATFLPALALSIRRMHDIDKSGWVICSFILVNFGIMFISIISLLNSKPIIALIGSVLAIGISIWYLVLCATRGTKGPNRFGQDPYQ